MRRRPTIRVGMRRSTRVTWPSTASMIQSMGHSSSFGSRAASRKLSFAAQSARRAAGTTSAWLMISACATIICPGRSWKKRESGCISCGGRCETNSRSAGLGRFDEFSRYAAEMCPNDMQVLPTLLNQEWSDIFFTTSPPCLRLEGHQIGRERGALADPSRGLGRGVPGRRCRGRRFRPRARLRLQGPTSSSRRHARLSRSTDARP
mmetsp:Transcript_66949/g.205031  ORF Transcript_66949/g.205031 Transcript_66949/m.205031 type:complete len:206 (-) Transcript_66949:493-1110(-)